MMRRGVVVFASLLALGLLHPKHGFITCSAFSVAPLPTGLRASHARLLLGSNVDREPNSFAIHLEHKVRKEYPISSFWEGVKAGGARMVSRLDTLDAAGLVNNNAKRKRCVVLQSNIGLMGHSGLLLASTVLVMVAKAFWKTIQQSRNEDNGPEEVTPVGSMDRCPWPFIFSHDPVQGMKDPPTWILVTWLVLWRVIKASSTGKIQQGVLLYELRCQKDWIGPTCTTSNIKHSASL